MEENLKQQLMELGLSAREAEVYFVLINFGPSTAGQISKKVNINRTSIYQLIDSLINNGLVNYIQKGKRKIFQATSPDIFYKLQEQKLSVIKELIPKLKNASSKEEEEVTLYSGRKGIRVIMNEVLDSKEYVSFGSSGEFFNIMKHDFYLFQKEKKNRKIKSRVIIGKGLKDKPIVTDAFAQFHFISDEYMTPTTTWIYNDKVAIIVWSETPVATLIKNKEVAKAYGSYFELLWKKSNNN